MRIANLIPTTVAERRQTLDPQPRSGDRSWPTAEPWGRGLLVVLDVMLVQEQREFRLRRHPAMMFFLSGNVAGEPLDRRLAHAEGRIPRLPGKVLPPLPGLISRF